MISAPFISSIAKPKAKVKVFQKWLDENCPKLTEVQLYQANYTQQHLRLWL